MSETIPNEEHRSETFEKKVKELMVEFGIQKYVVYANDPDSDMQWEVMLCDSTWLFGLLYSEYLLMEERLRRTARPGCQL